MAHQSRDTANMFIVAKTKFLKGPIPWLLPIIVVIAFFFLFPLLEVVRYSFTDASLLRPSYDYTLRSFTRVLSSNRLPGVLKVTIYFLVGSVIFQMLIGLAIALGLERGKRRRLPGATAVRAIVLSSWVIPGVAAGIVWRFVLSEASYGFINAVLQRFGLSPVPWLSSVEISVISVTIANIWRGTAFSMILLYAGLQSIDRQLYEAADIDGAGAWKSFLYITLPQLRPIALINMTLITIFTLNTFDLVLALTGGGPGRATEVLSLYTYNTVFQSFALGRGAALAMIMLVFSLILALFYIRLMPKED